MCLLSNDIHDYHFVSQGKVTVASIDDKEDMQFTDVSSMLFSRDIFSAAKETVKQWKYDCRAGVASAWSAAAGCGGHD